MQSTNLTYVTTACPNLSLLLPSVWIKCKYYVVDTGYPNSRGYLAPDRGNIICRTTGVGVGPED